MAWGEFEGSGFGDAGDGVAFGFEVLSDAVVTEEMGGANGEKRGFPGVVAEDFVDFFREGLITIGDEGVDEVFIDVADVLVVAIEFHGLGEERVEHGSIAGFEKAHKTTGSGKDTSKGAQPISLEDFYKTRVDVFIPAALEQMIKAEEASYINCRVIAEGANGPVTPEGDEVLEKRGIHCIPDILANAGGVTVSYFEWVQNKTYHMWDEERVDAELNRIMVMAARRTLVAKQKYDVPMRQAAYCSALEHLGAVYRVRGIFP